jgi:hypothetical protein
MTFFWEIRISYLRSCLVTPTWVDCLHRQFLSNFFTGWFGQIFLQSDVREVAVDMRDQFDVNTTVFTRVHTKNSADCDQEGWLLENPLGVATEREIHALAQGGRLYRLLFRRLWWIQLEWMSINSFPSVQMHYKLPTPVNDYNWQLLVSIGKTTWVITLMGNLFC